MKRVKILLVVIALVIGCAAFFQSRGITVDNLAKHSKKEMKTYISAFPWQDYRICNIPDLQANFYVDDIPDSIKDHLRRGIYWEGGIGNLIKTYTKPNTIAIDLGAHIGIHTLTMSRAVGEKGLVIAFEPQKKIFRELVHNMRLNECKNVKLLRNAVGESRKKAQMAFRQVQNEGGTSVGCGGDNVDMVTLDSLGLNNVSLIKMDVEYYEDYALQGARKTILRNKPVIIFEIMGNYDYNNCTQEIKDRFDKTINYVKSLGYDVELIFGNDYLARPL